MKCSAGVVTAGLIFLLASTVFAAHPLITDDTGTQEASKYQLEVSLEYAHNDDLGVTENETQAAAALTYGISNNLDVTMGFPWLKQETQEGGQTASESGIADISVSAKWRFYEREGLSFALRPGITLPTGNDSKGLGSGKTTYSLFFITTKELNPFLFHVNLGYIRNENKLAERVDLWHASLAGELAASEKIRIALNIGQERNPDQFADDAAFILAGLIYSVTESLDVDLGFKRALNEAEPDYTLLGGVTLRF